MTLFGTSILHRQVKDYIINLKDEELSEINYVHNFLLNKSDGKDWLLPYLCQYDDRYLPSISEAYYLRIIYYMIYCGDIYMRFIPVEDWADSDKNKESNFKILRDVDIEVYDKDLNDDGVFKINKPLWLRKLYINSEMTEKALENEDYENDKIIKNCLSGYIEFGTQSAAKTWQYLKNNIPLLRLPYNFNFKNLPSYAAIFINTKKFNPLDF